MGKEFINCSNVRSHTCMLFMVCGKFWPVTMRPMSIRTRDVSALLADKFGPCPLVSWDLVTHQRKLYVANSNKIVSIWTKCQFKKTTCDRSFMDAYLMTIIFKERNYKAKLNNKYLKHTIISFDYISRSNFLNKQQLIQTEQTHNIY